MKRLILPLALLLTVNVTLAESPKVSSDLQEIQEGTSVDVVVQYKKSLSEKQIEKVNNGIGKALGRTEKVRLHVIKGAVYSLQKSEIESLAEDSDVEYLSPNRELKGSLNTTAPTTFADMAWDYGYTGAGVRVAVIDSGYAKGAMDLAGSFDGVGDYIVSDGDGVDEWGHGTHVAGIIAGDGSESNGAEFKRTFRGIAPGVDLVHYRVLDAEGKGTDSAVIRAIEHIIWKNAQNQAKKNYKPENDFRVINLSLGRPVYESYSQDPLCVAVEEAWKAGIVVVVAAGNNGRLNEFGNEGYGTISSPGNSPYAITVGAMNANSSAERGDDVMASYSSKGPTLLDHILKPDLVAPGNKIISVAAKDSGLFKGNRRNRPRKKYYIQGGDTKRSETYFEMSGTSMAAAVVSGAAALLIEKEPGLTPDQVKARLMKTATKSFPSHTTIYDPATGQTYDIQYDIFTVGAGYLDIQAALATNDVSPAGLEARSPVAYHDAATGEVLISNEFDDVCGDSALWGRSVVCDDSALWGRTALWGRSALWGRTDVWGDSVFLDSTSALWGRAALWGRTTVEGSGALWGRSSPWGLSALWGRTDLESASVQIMVSGEVTQ